MGKIRNITARWEPNLTNIITVLCSTSLLVGGLVKFAMAQSERVTRLESSVSSNTRQIAETIESQKNIANTLLKVLDKQKQMEDTMLDHIHPRTP